MKETKIICDECGKYLTSVEDSCCEMAYSAPGAIIDINDKPVALPPGRWYYHFCDLGCLKKWINKR